ncbi:ribose-phosphate diphosphokinase [Spiroplasma chrysopicola]|uniref:Ribose-phosphate pyrophosphokinase n=1 Tax=Spiroplasma chrysopicola DF-1 TaxID=1276227 RepID=R4U0E6_9MOLU|nr:ribose-phosphate pyrophosphokinase [Spiroplasma chrysopicola]AGM24707.1 ribose-phosphate pyrophosphokinase [Spiroplasma chrysopicola DF-1]
MVENKNFSVYGLSASGKLADEICQVLNIKREEMEIIRFADGEILTRAVNSVRGKDIYIIQSTSNPVNENLMELLIAIDALKRGSANSINVIIPYFGYARQDRKAKGRQPITCKLVANMITTAGATRVMTIDLHSPQSMGFFDVPVDDLRSTQEFVKRIIGEIEANEITSEITIVSPDHGGLVRVREVADKLTGLPVNIAVIDKKRSQPNVSEVQFVLGEVKDRVCFIVDDMIDTAGTICNAARALKESGAKEVYLLACHGVFSPPACERLSALIQEGIVKKVIVTNTIDIVPERRFVGLEVISIAELIGNMIAAVVNKNSLSDVYSQYNEKIKELIKLMKK